MSDSPVVIYTPRIRYNSRTNFLTPLVAPFLRGAAIMGLEWTTLSYIEDAPRAVRVATFLVALAMLAVLQSKDWLNFKGKWYFVGSIWGLLLIYVAVVGLAYWNFQMQPSGHAAGGQPRVKTDVTRLLGALPVLSDFTRRGLPLNKDLAELLQQQPRLITSSLSINDAISRARDLQYRFENERTKFYGFLADHAYDREEINSIIDWNGQQRRRGEEYGVIVVDLGNYTNELARDAGNKNPASLLQNQAIWDFYFSLKEDQLRFFYWLTDTNTRINNKRAELQKALETAQ